MNTTAQMPPIAQTLSRLKLVDDNAIEGLVKEAKTGEKILTRAVEKKLVSGGELAFKFASQFGNPLVDISSMNPDYFPLAKIDFALAEKYLVLPIYQHDTKLYVAIADPTNKQAIDDIKFHTGLGIIPVQADPLLLRQTIEKVASESSGTLEDMLGDEDIDLDIAAEDDPADRGGDIDAGVDDAPVVKYVNKILVDAINRGASDIHVEPFEKKLRIRFRIDGMLHEIASQPVSLAGRLVARIKIISKLDIAERRVPQDGRIKLRLSKTKAIDFRVNTLPTVFGEKVVMRLLDSGSSGLNLDTLGFTAEQKKHYEEAISRPYGMVLITGPTGSGKTVSLYTALGLLNTIDKNISTAEDPVEIMVEGINQVNINEKAGLHFAHALRAFLRQDPDIIMVGEIRDLETAEISIKAAQTGHMVLSTLHTNDAPATLSRLMNMGVPPFNIASSVHLIVAQRLARRLCPSCKKPAEIPDQALITAGFKQEELKDLVVYKPVGCSNCTEGYKGRTGIFQVMPITHSMKSLIMEGCTQNDITEAAIKDGIMDLRQAALEKIREGVTSLEEVERVTNK